MATHGDTIAAEELFLYITNEGNLYRQMTEPMLKNLALKKHKGTYNHTMALKSWANLADAGAKLYDREFGSGTGSLRMFDKSTRMLTADKLQDYYEDMLEPEQWAGQRGFKTVAARKNPKKKIIYRVIFDEGKYIMRHVDFDAFKDAKEYAQFLSDKYRKQAKVEKLER